jgi:hypothetical protein
MTLTQDRDLCRGRAAAALVRAAGGSAMEAASAAISAVFGPGLDHRLLKQRVRSIMRRGLDNREIMARYAVYIGMFPSPPCDVSDLNGFPVLAAPRAAYIKIALWLVGMERSFERHQIAVSKHVHGVNRRPRISIMLLDELALILRWMRRRRVSN